ncbi:MAG: hypothetical protein ACPHSE_06890, partial [Flavobacteriaceae bacterium]
ILLITQSSLPKHGPKIEFGGVKRGLFKPTYQVGIASRVTKPESPPTVKHTIAPIIIPKKVFVFLFIFGLLI